MQLSPPPLVPAGQPCPIPEHVVFMVIKRCDDLAQGRTATLASLCRVSKRCRPLAAALLYRVVHLNAYGGVRQGTALHTLLWYPGLRAAVKSVKLSLDDAALVKDPSIALLLGGLVNVDEIEAHYIEVALHKVLSAPSVRVRRFKTWIWSDEFASLTWTYSAAFSTLERLDVQYVGSAGVVGPRAHSTRLSLAVNEHVDASLFAPFTAPFIHNLAGLRLPLWHDLVGLNLGACYRLEHLALAVPPMSAAAWHGSIFSAAVVALSMAKDLPFLRSFAISGTLLVLDPARATQLDRFVPMRPYQVPATASALLYAIPRQIEHLSLVTNAFNPAHVAAYLMSSYRPSGLRALRVGGGVGRGLAEILRDETGPHGGLKVALEEAGIEVTTVP